MNEACCLTDIHYHSFHQCLDWKNYYIFTSVFEICHKGSSYGKHVQLVLYADTKNGQDDDA